MLSSKIRWLYCVMIFLAIFVSIEFLVHKVFKKYSTGHIKVDNYTKLAEKGKADVVFLGASTIASGIISDSVSKILSKDLGRDITVYNLGIGASFLCYPHFLIKNVISQYDPELIVIGFKYESLNITEPDMGEDARYILFRITKLSDIPLLFKRSFTEFEDRIIFLISRVLPSFRYRYAIRHKLSKKYNDCFSGIMKGHTKEAAAQDVSTLSPHQQDSQSERKRNPLQHMIKHNGWQSAEFYAKKKELQKKEYYVKRLEENKLLDRKEEDTYLSDIVSYGEKENLDIVFISWPGTSLFKKWYYETEEYQKYLTEKKAYVESYGATLLDFGETNLVADKYYLDDNHTNEKGSLIFSEELAHYLSHYMRKKE